MQRIALFVLFLCLIAVAAPRLHAEESPTGDSEAAKAFRAAWWQETGAGDLEAARKGYEDAAAASGDASVRARALYRLAVVTLRMGRTDDARAVVDRLARAFPGQDTWVQRARKHMQAWAGEELAEGFSDWYRRYQMTPEFQARIVDLIITLGTAGKTAERNAAKEELKIAGPAALPALRAHATSAHHGVSVASTYALWEMGHVPPVEAILKHPYARSEVLIDVLGRVSAEERRALRTSLEQAAQGSEVATEVRAALRRMVHVLDGREATRAFLLTTDDANAVMDRTLMHWAFHTEDRAAFVADVKRKALDAGGTNAQRQRWLRLLSVPEGDITPTEILAWDSGEDHSLAWFAAQWLATPDVARAGGLDRLLAKAGDRSLGSEARAAALSRVLELYQGDAVEVPEDTLRHLLAEMLASRTHRQAFLKLVGGARFFGDGIARQVLTDALERDTGEGVEGMFDVWRRSMGAMEQSDQIRSFMELGKRASSSLLRQHVLDRLHRYDDVAAAEILRASGSTPLSEPVRDAVLRALAKRSADDVRGAMWARDDVAAIVDRLPAPEAPVARHTAYVSLDGVRWQMNSASLSSEVAILMAHLLAEPKTRPALQEEILRRPRRFSPHAFEPLERNFFKHRPEAVVALRQAFEQGRTTWTGADLQAGALIFAFVDWRALGQADRVLGLTRAFLKMPAVRADAPTLDALTQVLIRSDALVLDDLALAYDLAAPAGVALAIAHASRFPPSVELHDRLAAIFQATESDHIQSALVLTHYLRKALMSGEPAWESRRQALVERLLKRPESVWGTMATGLLQQQAQDIPLWLKALEHPVPLVRSKAASALGSVYNRTAVKALLDHLEDPAPAVRHAVMASLEQIEKHEEQKKRWREKMETLVPEDE